MRNRRAALAASFVVTVAAVSGCDDKPKYAPNPPPPTGYAPNPPAPTVTVPGPSTDVDAAASNDPTPTGDPIGPFAGDGGRRHIIANPPRVFDAPDGGYLDKRADGTCWWSESAPQPCPPNAKCNPSAPLRRVRCPGT